MKKLFCTIIAAASVMLTQADVITPTDARIMAEDGNIAGAIEALQEFLRHEPKNAEAHLLLGEIAWNSGLDSLAEATLEVARKQGSREALLQLAEMAADTYRFDRAEQLLSSYTRTNAGKKGRKAAPVDERAAELGERVERLRALMARVEKIAVIDSINVDAATFLNAYRLSPESGKIGFTETLTESFVGKNDGCTYFMPQSGRSLLWAQEDEEGIISLRQADALTGGEWEKPQVLDPMDGEEGDAAYPFMLPDGITLYYAADGDNSLGGLDIYMTRRTDDGFLEPVNLGMPYNSPFNDYMMAIDEYTGVGWFASDRNRLPGKVTVYIFVPSDIRVNVDADDPALRARALLSPISATIDNGADYSRLLSAVRSIGTDNKGNDSGLRIFIPGRGLITSYSQLQGEAARSAAETYADAVKEYRQQTDRLDLLRIEYGKGKTSVAAEIRELEQKLPAMKSNLGTLLNKVIKAAR